MQAIFILSTGRCGTQWIASELGRAFPELHVAHEPLRNEYFPRRMLSAKTPLALDPAFAEGIHEHAAARHACAQARGIRARICGRQRRSSRAVFCSSRSFRPREALM